MPGFPLLRPRFYTKLLGEVVASILAQRVTDVTHMKDDRVCIAGFNKELVPLRPDLPNPGIQKSHLYLQNQLIIRPRSIVRLNLEPKDNPVPPHTEDHHWLSPESITFERLIDEERWGDILSKSCTDAVKNIFGAEITDNKMIKPRTGKSSLGTIMPKSINGFLYNYDKRYDKYKYRLYFYDQSGEYYDLPIVDLTLQTYADHLYKQTEMDYDEISDYIFEKLTEVEKIWLRLGVTRTMRQTTERSEVWCYIQVTGIYTFPDYLNGKCFDDFED